VCQRARPAIPDDPIVVDNFLKFTDGSGTLAGSLPSTSLKKVSSTQGSRPQSPSLDRRSWKRIKPTKAKAPCGANRAEQMRLRGCVLLITHVYKHTKSTGGSRFIEAAPSSSATFSFRNCFSSCRRRILAVFF
jgi:hypothetical protein